MSTFVRPRVICDLAGVSYPTVMRDIARFDWKIKKHPQSRVRYFNLDDVMASYNRAWPIETIERAIARHDKPAAIETE